MLLKRRAIVMWKVMLLGVAVFATSTFPASADEEDARRSAVFDSLDKDGNGVLTADEIPKDKTDLFERLMVLGDADNDQKLTKAEFLATLKTAPAEPPKQAAGMPEFDPAELVRRFDANGDGKLSREEIPEPARERFDPLFEQLGKESVSAEDLTALKELAARFARPQPAELFRRLDANQDGQLSLDEVPQLLKPAVQAALDRLMRETLSLPEFAAAITPPPGRNAAPDATPGRGPRIVAVLDADGDGRLSKQELAMAPYHFDELDVNRDGRLDSRELFEAIPGRETSTSDPEPEPEPPAANPPQTPAARKVDPRGFAERFFAQFDADKDGFLSRDEIPPGKVADELGQMDTDGDGRISAAEFEAAVLRRRGTD